jgi:iduronate 2-sulfatase
MIPTKPIEFFPMKSIFILLSILNFAEGVNHEPSRPNVLMILVDDLKPALGVYGDKVAVTPNLDRLAARGMRFDFAYCNTAVCAPSRLNLLTGARSTTTGIYGFGRDFRSFFPDAVTMPQHFKKHGYRAESLGKVFHVGHGCEDDQVSWSVPHFKDLVIEYVDPRSKPDGKLTREEGLFSNRGAQDDDGKMRPRGAAWEMPEVEDDAYADGRVAAEASRRLREARNTPDEPFFMMVGFARPHLPFSVPKRYWDLYDRTKLVLPEYEMAPEGAPREAQKRGGEISQFTPIPDGDDAEFSDDLKRNLIHGYYASMSYVDAQIGKVIKSLDDAGLAEETIIVLWGDHGFHLGELGIWTKHVNYELANRIPLLVVAPGVTKPQSSTRQLAETVDLYPTLVDLCGLPKPSGSLAMDGLSLVPVLKDPSARVRDHAYHCYQKERMGRAIRTEQYRLVEWKRSGAPDESAAIELYDYTDGPVERKNLALEKPEVVERLRKILRRHPEAKIHR